MWTASMLSRSVMMSDGYVPSSAALDGVECLVTACVVTLLCAHIHTVLV